MSFTEASRPGTTAFVLSGGASLGAVQVGMLQALRDAGITPDVVFGTSVGAVNAAWIAGHPHLEGLDDLAEIWTGLRTRDVFPLRALTGLRALAGFSSGLVPNDALRRLVERYKTFDRLEDAPIPLHVVTTDALTGEEVVLHSGDTIDALTASAAIPGVFPPVEVGGRTLIDGAVANNAPISCAVALGVETVYVLPTGYACALERLPRHPLAVALQAVSLLLQRRLIQEVARYDGAIDLRVAPPLCPLRVSPADFSQARPLISRARVSTARWLEHGPPDADQTRVLGFHPRHHDVVRDPVLTRTETVPA